MRAVRVTRARRRKQREAADPETRPPRRPGKSPDVKDTLRLALVAGAGIPFADRGADVVPCDFCKELRYKGRFGAGLTRINDGSLLFLQHMISKMKPV